MKQMGKPVLRNHLVAKLVRFTAYLMAAGTFVAGVFFMLDGHTDLFLDVDHYIDAEGNVQTTSTPRMLGLGVIICLLMALPLLPLVFTIWLYRAVTNLRRMGIQTQLEARWIIVSWILTPLILFSFVQMLKDTIMRNSHIYRFMGRRKGDQIMSERKLQRFVSAWWIGMWLTMFSYFILLPPRVAAFIYPYQKSFFGYDLIMVSLFALPAIALFLASGRLIRQVSRLETRVLDLWDAGLISKYRSETIVAGRLAVDNSDAPKWYLSPEELQLTPPTDQAHIFQDQHPKPANSE